MRVQHVYDDTERHLLESDYYRLRSKKFKLSVDDSLVRIDVEVPVSDCRVMGRTYGYSDVTYS